MDDVSKEEVDAIEFMRIDDIEKNPRLLCAMHVLSVHGTSEDVEAAAKALHRIAAKAMRRKQ
jgi:selenocysteine lyase/cysteine desulfurase